MNGEYLNARESGLDLSEPDDLLCRGFLYDGHVHITESWDDQFLPQKSNTIILSLEKWDRMVKWIETQRPRL